MDFNLTRIVETGCRCFGAVVDGEVGLGAVAGLVRAGPAAAVASRRRRVVLVTGGAELDRAGVLLLLGLVGYVPSVARGTPAREREVGAGRISRGRRDTTLAGTVVGGQQRLGAVVVVGRGGGG